MNQKLRHKVSGLKNILNTMLIFAVGFGIAIPNNLVLARMGLAANRPAAADAGSAAAEWSQEGHDAQRTGFTAEEPQEPWTLSWTWNGPDANGGTGGHIYDAPKDAHTVTGGSNVFAPAGASGLYALRKSDGVQAWHRSTPAFNATPAYDSATGALFAGGADGILYKLDGATGSILSTYNAGGALNKAVLLVGGSVFVQTDSGVLHKVSTTSMTRAWAYTAGSNTATPAAYSAGSGLLVFCTADLYVHAVRESDGVAQWRVKPTSLPAAAPYTFEGFWPVVAEQHGIVFVRLNLGAAALWSGPGTGTGGGGVYPMTNADTRALLQSNNGALENLFALDLNTGGKKFIPAVGYGGIEYRTVPDTGLQLVAPPVPVIKVNPDGSEVAYISFRSGQGNVVDGRWDSHMGEMVLDDTTLPGLEAGDLRFVDFPNSYVRITDEQTPFTMAGDTIFQAHWGASEGLKILDRSATKGLTAAAPITAQAHPAVIRRQQSCSNFNPLTHYTTCGLTLVNDGRYWNGSGFWTYWNVIDPPPVSGGAFSLGNLPHYTYVSDGAMYVEGNGGDLMAFRYSGGVPSPTPTAVAATPTRTFTSLPPTATKTATPLPPTATKTATPLPPTATKTATPLPPTATKTFTSLPPTATKTATPLPPTATMTATPLPPTAIMTFTPPAPTATKTFTPLPTATKTATPLPPTATITATPLPPTATATAAPLPTSPVSGSITLKTYNDFNQSCAVMANSHVNDQNDGNVVLAASTADHFDATGLDSTLWVSGLWGSSAADAALTGSLLAPPDNGYIRSRGTYTHGMMETIAQFGQGAWQHIGFGSDSFSGNRYFLLSTYNGDGNLYARVNNNGSEQKVSLGAVPTGLHRYRIEWNAVDSGSDSVVFFMDGVQKAQMTVSSAGASGWYLYISNSGTGQLRVDQIQVTPVFVNNGTYITCALDAGTGAAWNSAAWTSSILAGTTLAVQSRTSANGVAWESWSPLAASGSSIASPSRYVQFQVALTTTNTQNSPALISLVVNKTSGAAPTATQTPLPTATQTPVPTATKTLVPTATQTLQPTATKSALPTATRTPRGRKTALPTTTKTSLPTATKVSLPTATKTSLPTATKASLPTATKTSLPTATKASLPTATKTSLPTATKTSLPTATQNSFAHGNEDFITHSHADPNPSHEYPHAGRQPHRDHAARHGSDQQCARAEQQPGCV